MNSSLLSEILDLMRDGRVHSRESLVAALGTSAAMADLMIEHLIHLGYLEQIGGDPAPGFCSLCDQSPGSRAQCTLCHQQGRALLLTSKGMKSVIATEAKPDPQA